MRSHVRICKVRSPAACVALPSTSNLLLITSSPSSLSYGYLCPSCCRPQMRFPFFMFMWRSPIILTAGAKHYMNMSAYVNKRWLVRICAGVCSSERLVESPLQVNQSIYEEPKHAVILSAYSNVTLDQTRAKWLKWSTLFNPSVLAISSLRNTTHHPYGEFRPLLVVEPAELGRMSDFVRQPFWVSRYRTRVFQRGSQNGVGCCVEWFSSNTVA